MIDVEQTSKKSLPFQEECNKAHFFSGAGRGDVLRNIQQALTEKAELVILIGDAGSGKTMLCKMVQEQWNTTNTIVSISSRVESFEDVARVVAQESDIAYPVDATRADAKRIFLDLTESLRKNGTGLLLICDEAENMYLATLERIRKIIDDVNAQGGGLQVLFAGRNSLEDNLAQLDLCDFKSIIEKQFFLSTLTEHEIWSYLNFCVREYRGTVDQEIFTKEAAARIALLSRGNLRTINSYADESLQASSDESSFLVLLDHVKDGGGETHPIASGSNMFSQLPLAPKYIFLGALFLVVSLLTFLLSGGDEEEQVVNVPKENSGPVSVIPSIQQEKEIEKVVEPMKKPAVPDAVKRATPKSVLEVVPADEEKQLDTPVSPVPATSKVTPPEHQTPVAISPVEIVEKSMAAQDVPELTQQSKIVAEKTKRVVTLQISASKKKKIPVIGELPPVMKAPAPMVSHDPVLGKAVAAGEKWMAGEADSSFTIQLMSLISEQAEDNLKQIVSQSKYQAVADKLVVLTQASDPPAILVFYGIYPSMSIARNARNNMPIFLRDRHPYPVSVRGAVEKARAE